MKADAERHAVRVDAAPHADRDGGAEDKADDRAQEPAADAGVAQRRDGEVARCGRDPRVMSIVNTQMSEMSRRSYTRWICERVSMPGLATAWSS